MVAFRAVARIVVDTFIKAPPARCFDLALDVEAHAESAAFSGERVTLPGKTSGKLEAGDLLTFEGRHLGIRQRFTVKFTQVDRPRQFTDEMIHGIFRRLLHVHEFHPRDGGTLMRDLLEWETPLGLLGRLADLVYLRRHMRWFVTTKQLNLKRIIER